MASLATIVRGFVGVREDVDLIGVAVRPRTESCRLRPLANEDVYFFAKRIDNSTVVRAVNTVERRNSVGAVVTGFVMAAFVIAGLFPAAYNTMEGYHIQQLRQEQVRLKQEHSNISFSEAKLLSQENLNRLAAKLKMVDPAPQQIEFLEGNTKHEARNVMPLESNTIAH